MAHRSYFWITLIILPTILICVVSLIGIFFAEEDRIVENAVKELHPYFWTFLEFSRLQLV